MNTHFIIISLIILTIGSLAGVTNFLNYYFKGLIKSNFEIIKYIASGIGASILVPLLLNMLSSDLIKETLDFDCLNYFVFAGFCFVAGYFSDRFINSVGDKILKDLARTNDKVDQVISSTKANEEKIDFIVSTETEIDEIEDQSKFDLNDFKVQSTFEDDDMKTQIDKILKSFTGKYKFRTVKGISKELNYNETVTKSILDGLQGQGVIKKLTSSDGKVLLALTNLGLFMFQKDREEKTKNEEKQ
ncbi:MAG: YEATS-associated helix-containing protein [Salinivirgaceae bacterium]